MVLVDGLFPAGGGEESNKMQMPRNPSLGCFSDDVNVCIGFNLAFLFSDSTPKTVPTPQLLSTLIDRVVADFRPLFLLIDLNFFEFGFKFSEIIEKDHESAMSETLMSQTALNQRYRRHVQSCYRQHCNSGVFRHR
jgi:hypothetical protein